MRLCQEEKARQKQPPGKVKEEVQKSKDGNTPNTESQVTKERKPLGRGVTVRAVQLDLFTLYREVVNGDWYPRRLLPQLGDAIRRASMFLNTFPASGGISGTDLITRKTWDSLGWEYRLDINNLEGHNLRYLE
jgi:hypothetical protein